MSRPPRPTRQKIKEGEPNKNRINYNEPQPRGKTISPLWLNKQARNEWKRVTSELGRLGLFTKLDRMELAVYSQSVGMLVEVENKINELTNKAFEIGGDATNAYLLKTKAGNISKNPLLAIRNKLIEQVHTSACEFGMTPVSRSRIDSAHKDKDGDPMEELFREIENKGK